MSSPSNADDNTNNTSSDEAVSQFLALTGSSDPSQAQTYLEMSANSIETAVNLYFEHQSGGGGGGGGGFGGSALGGGGSTSTSATTNTRSSHHRTSTSSGFGDGGVGGGGGGSGGLLDDVRAPDQTRTMRLMDFEGPPGIMGVGGGGDMAGLLNHPVLGPHAAAMMNQSNATGGSSNDHVDQMMAQMSAFAEDHDMNDVGMITRRRGGTTATGSGSVRDMINASTNNANATSPSGDSVTGNVDDDEIQITGSSRPNSLHDLFAPPVNLMHTAGGFQGARNVAKNARRWLLVNLQNDSDFSCHALNRDVWRDELVENLVRSGFIFWQNVNTSPDGQTYAQRYNVTSYPHIGIIDPRTARLIFRREGWTQENPLTAERFAELAADFCSQHSFDKPPSIPRADMNTSSTSGGSAAAAAADAPAAVDRMTEEEQLQAAIRASMNEASGLNSTTQMNVDDDDDDDDDDDEVMICDDEYEYIDDDDDDDDDEDGNNDNTNNMKTEEKDETNIEEDIVEEVKEVTFHDEIIAIDVGDEPDGTDGVARIMIRMPDGKRLVRKFKLGDTVKIVYAFVAQSNDDAKGGKEFEIKAGFPPKNLLPIIDDTIQNSGLAGDSVTVRWKED